MGLLAIAGGIAANGRTVAFLVAPALALAASANLSTLVYTLFRRRFTTATPARAEPCQPLRATADE